MGIERGEIQTQTQKGIWSPLAITLFCLFFSFLAAGIMNAISYGRIGDMAKKSKRLLLVIGIFIVFIILALVLPDGTSPLFTGFHVATILYFRFDQKKIYDEHVANGGKKAGIWIPLVIAIASFIVLIILFAMAMGA